MNKSILKCYLSVSILYFFILFALFAIFLEFIFFSNYFFPLEISKKILDVNSRIKQLGINRIEYSKVRKS